MLYRLSVGSLDRKRQLRNVRAYSNENWFEANEFQTKVLTAACSQ